MKIFRLVAFTLLLNTVAININSMGIFDVQKPAFKQAKLRGDIQKIEQEINTKQALLSKLVEKTDKTEQEKSKILSLRTGILDLKMKKEQLEGKLGTLVQQKQES